VKLTKARIAGGFGERANGGEKVLITKQGWVAARISNRHPARCSIADL